MREHFERLFAEQAEPTHSGKRAVHDALAPVADVATAAQLQVIHMRGLVTQIELADHDHRWDGKLEHIHQTFAATERNAAAVSQSVRDLAHSVVQLERYIAELQAGVDALDEPVEPEQ